MYGAFRGRNAGVVWISRARLHHALGADGERHAAPDLIVEVLSPGAENERRDRELKSALYARQGVEEYWIVDRAMRQVFIYRRESDDLQLVETLDAGGVLQSPSLSGFSLPVAQLFFASPR